VPPLPPRVPGAKLHHVQRNLHWTCKGRFSLETCTSDPVLIRISHVEIILRSHLPISGIRRRWGVGGLEGKIWAQESRNRRGNLRVLFLFRVTHHVCHPQPQTLLEVLSVLCLFTEEKMQGLLTYVAIQ